MQVFCRVCQVCITDTAHYLVVFQKISNKIVILKYRIGKKYRICGEHAQARYF